MEPSTPDSTARVSRVGVISPLSIPAWHRRFLQQAGWTRDLRQYLYRRAKVPTARRILEVGCGTGALTAEWSALTSALIVGLDCSAPHLEFARQHDAATPFTQGDARALPYSSGVFDATYCHYLLLWVHDPLAVLAEMRRVTRRGGAVLALAEPDYGARIDYPPGLEPLGRWQYEALKRQGAEPETGRRLGALFARAGLQTVETGVLGGQWQGLPEPEVWEAEWTVLQADLQGWVSPDILAQLSTAEAAAWQRGERVLFVPTFYAWGQVK
jgi:SAM-dependent methyltransferase